jgi:hypothetical protein
MGFSPRIYEVHLWLQDPIGDWWWEPNGGAYEDYNTALKWYKIYKEGGHSVKIVETKVVRLWEDDKEYT